jgi:uncharacterized membrane protein SpoIIM required for sporulation
MTPRQTGTGTRLHRLESLCLCYAAVLAMAMTAGAALAAWQGHVLSVERVGVPPSGGAFLLRVLEFNGRIWLYMCIGLASFGVAGLSVLLGNAFRFGMDVMSMARGAPHELVYLLPHAALEFAAFTLAGASCQYLAWWLFELLVLDRTHLPARAGVQALAVSFVLLVIAACVETLSASVRFGA